MRRESESRILRSESAPCAFFVQVLFFGSVCSPGKKSYLCNMIIKLYPENPNERTVRQVVDLLRRGGVIVYPTDTVYALGCALDQPKAIERLRSIRGGEDSSEMSIVCSHIPEVAE